jgi:prephenate dehydratase
VRHRKEEDLQLRIAFQGERGAYSEAAALGFFGQQIEPLPCASFDLVFQRVEGGTCERGIVPIENSLAGSIHRNYDLLLQHDLSIVGEINLRIVHCLIAHPGVGLGEIRRIYSHPQALAQCEGYLDGLPGVERVPTYDTAGSVKLILEQGIREGAAIASRQAARVYNMAMLAEGIEDDAENYTRFLVLARDEIVPEGPAKTSIVYSVPHLPGSLFKSLSVFALRDINLTKIESRPLKGKPWEYIFYLDFEGSMAEERCKNALNHLREYATFLRVLGSYPRAESVHESTRQRGTS